jgi:hypothetical protein
MQINDTISIITASGFGGGNTMISAGVHAEIIEVSEKAVKLQGATRSGKIVSAWLPKKALKAISTATIGNSQHSTCELARWFSPSGWTATFLDICEDCSVLAPT